MGKGGKNKIKTYKPPSEKFVVVTKAWGVDKSSPKVTCNQIGAWFEVMLSERYPGTRPFGIYYHPKKMHYFIVELPSNVDITPFLGCHPYDSFLKGIRTSPNDVACLYEYNYKNFGNPEKTWNQGFADYARVPEGFPVRSPYPQPEPAVPPPTDLPCAIYPPTAPPVRAPPQIPIKPLPEHMAPLGLDGPSTASSSTLEPSPVVLPETQATNTAHPMAPPEHCSRPRSSTLNQEALPSGLSTFQPYEPPSHYIKPQSPSQTPTIGSPEASSCAVTPVPSSAITPETSIKLQKWDPYEEEEAAEALLRSTSLDVGINGQDTKAFIKDEANDDHEALTEDRDMDRRTSQDVDDGVLDFLESVVPTTKLEHQDSVPPETHDQLSRSATIDTAMDDDDEDDYVPSAALAAAFASMAEAADAPSLSLSVKAEQTEHRIPRVKEEPRDVELSTLSASPRNATPSSMATSRSERFSSEVSVPASSTTSKLSASRSATVNSDSSDARRLPEIPTYTFIKPEPVEDILPPPIIGAKRPVVSLEGPAPSDALRFKKVKRKFQ